MLGNGRIQWVGLCVIVGSAQALAANPFPTAARRQAFLQALARQDQSYDAAARMLQASFSSPGYHTTLTGGTVHRTRETLKYAVALLDAGDPERFQRAEQILDRVIALQDQEPNSPTYGIWSWFLEEPLDKMSPPDWNWADFCGTQLLQVAIDHANRLSPELQQRVKDSILHAARSIQRRNVGPGYTNIALMGTYVTLVAGERLGVPALRDYGKQRLRRFYDYTQQKGSFSEYNSPTYTLVAIEEISRMRQHVRDLESRELLEELNEFAWRHLARRFHPPTKQWAGPHSRCYATLLRPSALAAIQQASGDRLEFLPAAQAWESLDAHRLRLHCPNDLLANFTNLNGSREEVEAFEKNAAGEHDIIGTTYLHPDFALGSVNVGDFWNQRRPLLAYWQTPGGPVALRLRCLHDDYDYACASLFTVQDKGDVLGAVLFATDRGDTHISLDRIRNATIRARDLRLRLELEGAVRGHVITTRSGLNEPIVLALDPIEATWCLHAAPFDGLPVRVETGRDSEAAWVDLVLYSGPEREFDFGKMKEAAVVFTLSVTPAAALSAAVPSVHSHIARELEASAGIVSPRQTWSWQRTNNEPLALTIPLKPLPTREQKKATAARAGNDNPWKASY
ncbi:MAG: hypothetical protein MUC88_06110 [Planctomycetes bacterium]|jgi:hypothetical protein|nr:hypothetical protein [Planctomycetota bacterium]